jgi:hypothetical protein
MKLKLFKEAEQELKQFENFEKSEFFYESHPEFYPNRKGKVEFYNLLLNVFLKALYFTLFKAQWFRSVSEF